MAAAVTTRLVWSAYTHTVSELYQEGASEWYVHIGENPEKMKSAQEAGKLCEKCMDTR